MAALSDTALKIRSVLILDKGCSTQHDGERVSNSPPALYRSHNLLGYRACYLCRKNVSFGFDEDQN